MPQVQYGLVIPPVGGVASFNKLTAARGRCYKYLLVEAGICIFLLIAANIYSGIYKYDCPCLL